MKFDEALYKKENTSYSINRNEIGKRRDFNEIIKYLYCPENNCNARLVYNRRTPSGYFSKHRSDEHIESCRHFTDKTTLVHDEFYYEEVVGSLSEVTMRRKNQYGVKKLLNILRPNQDDITTLNSDKNKVKLKREKNEQQNKKKLTKIVHDPSSKVSEDDLRSEGAIVRGPRHTPILPHELLAERDSNKGINTSGTIESIKVFDKNKSATIKISLEGVYVSLEFPNAFFESSTRSVIAEQLIEFLNILKEYVQRNPGSLYITTICESQTLKQNDLHLSVYDPAGISFTHLNKLDKTYHGLSSVVAAISTGVV